MNELYLYTVIIAASEASSDTIFYDSRTTCAPADGKNPVPADVIGSQPKMLWAGWLAVDDHPSTISSHSKMVVVVCNTVIPFFLVC